MATRQVTTACRVPVEEQGSQFNQTSCGTGIAPSFAILYLDLLDAGDQPQRAQNP